MSDASENTPAPEVPPTPPPASEPPPPVGSGDNGATAATTETGLSATVAAGLATFFGLIGGIIFFILEKKNQFVRFYALQAIYLWSVTLAVCIVATIVNIIIGFIPFIGWLIAIFIGLATLAIVVAAMVVWVISLIKSFTGVEWEIPVLGKYVREHLATGKLPFAK
jgi:uncharacterized membrane protein